MSPLSSDDARNRRWPGRYQASWRCLLVALVLLAYVSTPSPAAASGDQGRGSGQGGAGAADQDADRSGPGSRDPRGVGGGGRLAGDQDSEQSSGEQPGTGQVNPLDIANPVCDEALRPNERRNCAVTGTPEGRYPTSNYGIDVHIDTGVDNIVGNFQALLAQLANAIWLGLLFVLNLVLTLLGWALELSPFTDNATMAEVSAGLERFYRVFTSPFFVFAIVSVGAWGVYRGLVKREFAQTIAGTVLTVALMLAGLWILHQPEETVGTVSEITNDAAVAVIAAPQEGSLSSPHSSYAEATSEVWSGMTLPGFAALNFSDMGWALSKPDPELLATANEKACLDYAYLSQLPKRVVEALAAVSAFGGNVDCAEVAAVAPVPRTNAEIWLRSSPGSAARESLWEEHTDELPYASYLAIQGDSGAWTRLPLVCLIGLGLLGGIALLAWLALRIFVQTAVAFVLVLSTPVALFLPAFGERGRAAFAFWAGTLAGALISKLIYAALLAVVLFATTVIAAAVPTGAGAFMAFLVMAALWWAIFLKRDDILSFLSVSDDEGGSGRLGNLTGIYATRVVAQRLSGALGGAGRGVKGVAGVRGGGLSGIASDRAEGARGAARAALDRQATKRLASRYQAEKAVMGEQAARRGKLAELAAQRSDALKEARRHGKSASLLAGVGGADRERHLAAKAQAEERAQALRETQGRLRERIAVEEPREERARAFVGAADERKRSSGSRFSGAEISQAKEAIRRDADKPISDPAHAWRVGMSPERYSALSGREREEARATVSEQLRADGVAFGAISSRPPGLVRARNRTRMRRQALATGGEGKRDLHEARLRARRKRRATRRGISR